MAQRPANLPVLAALIPQTIQTLQHIVGVVATLGVLAALATFARSADGSIRDCAIRVNCAPQHLPFESPNSPVIVTPKVPVHADGLAVAVAQSVPHIAGRLHDRTRGRLAIGQLRQLVAPSDQCRRALGGHLLTRPDVMIGLRPLSSSE